jgi:hypothetical protein
MPAAAQPARLYDKEVKSLVEQAKKTFDRFWDALDSQLKNTTFKGPSGEWVVKKVGEDYKNVIDIADKRIAPTYSASTEVGNIFTEAVRINNYVAQQGSGMKGASEWQAHTAVLGQLAHEFGGSFPPAQGQAYRRYTDKEIITATTTIEASSKQLASALENALKKDKGTPEATRKSMVADVKRVGETAKLLGSTVKDGKPASAQVTSLLDQAKKVRETLTASGAASAVQGQWTNVSGQIGMIATTFHQQF